MSRKIVLNALQASSSGAGISRYVTELVKCFQQKTSDVLIVARKEMEGVFKQENTVFINKDFSSSRKRIIAEQTLPLSLDKDVQLLHYPDFAGPLLTNKPFIITIHDLAYIRHAKSYTTGQRIWKTQMTKWSLKKAKRIITVSNFTKNELIELLDVDPDKIDVIHCGFNPSQFDNTDENIEFLEKNKLCGQPYILYVGTLAPQKNIPMLIKSFYNAKQNGLKHKLVIAGKKGWMYDDIFKLVDDLNLEREVIFTGFVPDNALGPLYRDADFVTYLSLYEGFGFPPLEAMSFGVPVLTSNVASIPEVVGDAALKVNPCDLDEIVHGMLRLSEDQQLKRDLINKGYERIKLFSWEKAAEETLKVYEKVLKEL